MKKYKIILAILTVLIITCTSYFILRNSKEDLLIKKGNQIVLKIEEFKNKNERLPYSLNEINIQERLEGPFYYEKKDSNNYILWFGTELGESTTYDSKLKQWQ